MNWGGGAVTPYWFKVLLIFGVVTGFGFWALGFSAAIRSLRPWVSMNSNRTEAATFFKRLNPIWFLQDDLLNPQGRLDRAKVIVCAKRFFIGWVGVVITVGAIMLIGFSVARPPN